MADQAYEIKKDVTKKEVTVVLKGAFDERLLPQFMNDFKTSIATITTGEYTLHLDAKEFPVQTPDAVSKLVEVTRFYNTLGFKEIVLHKKDSAISAMQINRVLREANLQNVKVL